MTITKKILIMTACLFTVITVFCFVGFNLGYNGLLLMGEINVSPMIQAIITHVLFYTNLILMYSVILDMYGFKIIKVVGVYAVFNISIATFCGGFMASGVLPFVYVLLYALWRRDFKKSFLRFLAIYSAIAVYQGLALIMKLGSFRFGYADANFYQGLVFSIDLIIYLILMYCIGGEKYYVQLVNVKSNKRNLLSEAEAGSSGDYEDCLAEEEFRKLVGLRRVKAVSLLLGFQILQWAVILFVCALGHVLIEGIVITASFVAYGFIIRHKWHSNSILVCTLTSATMFYVAAKAILAFGYTQLFPVIVGLLLLYSLYQIAVHQDHVEQLKQELSKLKSPKFSCSTATEDELRARCIQLGKNDEYINFVILAFRSGKTRKEIAAELFLAESTVKEYKRIRKKELEA